METSVECNECKKPIDGKTYGSRDLRVRIQSKGGDPEKSWLVRKMIILMELKDCKYCKACFNSQIEKGFEDPKKMIEDWKSRNEGVVNGA